MIEISIGVKELAQHLFSSGDLTSEFFYNQDENDGKKAHQYLQNKYGPKDKKEVYIKRDFQTNNEVLHLNGFIDGVLAKDDKVLIEEIKSTKKELKEIEEDYHQEYLGQLKLYMAMYLLNNDLNEIEGQLTYIYLDDYTVKKFSYSFTKSEMEEFFNKTIENYLDWMRVLEKAKLNRKDSLKELRFPFDSYREGQKEMMKAVYYVLDKKDILYAVAPTGIGKTVSVLYPGLKSLANNDEKLFYLSAKGSLKKLAISTVDIMVKKGLNVRLLEISSKEKMCFMKLELCEPENCPYAKGFFSRLNKATEDIFKNENMITSDKILSYANAYRICPFEYSLHISNYSDVIVCDYNYVFDPKVHLIRYFEEDNANVKLLIDEAHNLVDRSRSMFSAECTLKEMQDLKKLLRGKKPSINASVTKLSKYLEQLEADFSDDRIISSEKNNDILRNIDLIVEHSSRIFEDYEASSIKNRSKAIHIFLNLKNFQKISDYFGSSHRFVIEKKEEDYVFKIICLDASSELYSVMSEKVHGTVLFSATMTPLEYYKSMLSNGFGEHIILPSPFEQRKLDLILMNKISTYYKDRASSVEKIEDVIEVLFDSKPGNYIAFFPSYQYLRMVSDSLLKKIGIKLIIQEPEMNEVDREVILEEFESTAEHKLGLFVMGGIFSEGIDFVGDRLSGVIVVGVGIPQINYQNEMIKKHFEDQKRDGFDYAYTYPGFNKVQQAAGRVIRSDEDRGVVILIDSRITSPKYLSLFPQHWNHYKVLGRTIDLRKELKDFWK